MDAATEAVEPRSGTEIRAARRRLLAFFALAFGISWAAWMPVAAASWGLFPSPIPPTLAALIGAFLLLHRAATAAVVIAIALGVVAHAGLASAAALDGFHEARIMAEISLLPANVRVATGRRPVAMAVGAVDQTIDTIDSTHGVEIFFGFSN